MTIRINGVPYAEWELKVLLAVEQVKTALARILGAEEKPAA